MARLLRATVIGVLLSAGSAGVVVLLVGEGLDRAEKWVSVVGVVASVALGAAGVVLGWATWRRSRIPQPAPTGRQTNAEGARGVQIGDHNTQHNTF